MNSTHPYEGEQQRRLTTEERKIRIKKLKRKRRFRLAIVVVGLLLLLSLFCAPIVIFTAFKVQGFAVEGSVPYSEEQISNACAVQAGQNLLFADLEQAEASLETALPYIQKAEISRRLPDTLVISVEPATERYALYVESTSTYLILSGRFKILRESGTAPQGIPVIESAEPKSKEVGSRLSFAEDGQEKDGAFNALLEAAVEINRNSIENITLINIKSLANIKVIYQDRIIMKLGSDSNLAAKINLAAQVLEQEDAISQTQQGTIDLTISKKAYFSTDSFDESELHGDGSAENDEDEDETDEEDEAPEDSLSEEQDG